MGQTYRLRVRVGGLVLGYADIQIAANGREAKDITGNEVIGLVDGRTLGWHKLAFLRGRPPGKLS